MTDCYVALGSNLEPKLNNLEKSIELLKNSAISDIAIAPVYQTPALLAPGSPPEWNKPFLNTAVHFKTKLTPEDLLKSLKNIEHTLGRNSNLKWGPRPIDLDILFYGNTEAESDSLSIPHPRLLDRDFVLKPLLDIIDYSHIPKTFSDKIQLIKNKVQLPAWMHIYNLSPDSFSDGSEFDSEQCKNTLQELYNQNIQYIDIGAASTRPNAKKVLAQEEITRLNPFLDIWSEFTRGKYLVPKLSLDSMHAEVVHHVMKKTNLDLINDVSGLKDPGMIPILQESSCNYVLMHSLSAPVDPSNVIPDKVCPIHFLKRWLDQKLELLDKHRIDLNRIIFDPGIGFGKTAQQSLQILQNIEHFKDTPCPLLLGHSRKSFMSVFSSQEAQNRDYESIGISMALAKYADIFRVHNANFHQRAWLAQKHCISNAF